MEDGTPVTGQPFTLSVTVRNQGAGSSSTTTLRYHRSADSVISSDDDDAGTVQFPALDASGSSHESITLTAPSTPGAYHYGACINAASDESDTTNNCSSAVVVTVIPPPPDLSVDGLTVDDDSPVIDQLLTLSVLVRNQGTGSSNTTTLKYYRSADSAISSDDDDEGTVQIPALDASGSRDESITLAAPSIPGTYHYGACVDPVSVESDTTNNCSDAVVVTVSPTPWPTYVAETTTAWPKLPPVSLEIATLAAPGNFQRERQVDDAIVRLREIYPDLATRIEELSWIEDGISIHELWAADGLIDLAAAGYGRKLLELPWVVEGTIHPALESLSSLEEHYPELLDGIMAHPSISDGITPQEAKAIVPLWTIVGNPDLQSRLLDPEQVSLEEQVITLPLSGETELTIIRTRPGNDFTMGLLERAARTIEEFMGLPFPRQQLIIFFENDPDYGIADNAESHVSILVDEQSLSEEVMLSLLTHEVSHEFWGSRTPWISEGAATFFESVPRNLPGRAIDHFPCALYRTIAELEDGEGTDANTSIPVPCDYSLGERLFHDLYRNTDETTFRLAFRRLYLQNLFNNSFFHEPNSATSAISLVKEAFAAYASEETSTTVDRIIARWYDGSEHYDLSWIEDFPVEADIAAIEGRIESAFLSQTPDGPPVSIIVVGTYEVASGYLNLDYSFENSAGSDALPIEIAVSFEDGFEFARIPTELPLPVDGARGTHSIWFPGGGALGHYWVQAFWEGRKIAEATFEVVRAVDRRSIRGVVATPDGRPPGSVALSAKRGEESFDTKAGPSGVFDLEVPFGSFVLEVSVSVGSQQHFVGWYDGSGGITTARDQAYEVIVDGASVNGIAIKLPAVSDASISGVIYGSDGRPHRDAELSVKGANQEFTSAIRQDGTFNVEVPPGSYTLEVTTLIGTQWRGQWRSVGWYDGNDGITTVHSQAYEVGVYGANIADLEINLPAVDHSISGLITGLDGLPSTSAVALNAKNGDLWVWVDVEPDGSFEESLSSGSYVLDVLVGKANKEGGSDYYFVGWYGGSGITTDPTRAFEVIVKDADIEGVEIILPADTDSLFCSNDSHRSTITGRCPWD